MFANVCLADVWEIIKREYQANVSFMILERRGPLWNPEVKPS